MFQIKRRGFSLVELLVVIAIIAVLAGIILPAIARARELGKRAVCLSNIHQLTAAWLMYAGANYGRFATARIMPTGIGVAVDDNGNPVPDVSAWLSLIPDDSGIDWPSGRLWPYLRNQQVYWCPDDPRDRNPRSLDLQTPCVSYEMNGFMGELTINQNNVTQGVGVKMRTMGQIKHPSGMLLFIEANPGVPSSTFWPPVYSPANHGQMNNAGFQHDKSWPSHFHTNSSRAEGCTISFADGHALFWQYIPDKPAYDATVSGDGAAPGLGPFSLPDKLQLEAWSGGPIPPGVTQ